MRTQKVRATESTREHHNERHTCVCATHRAHTHALRRIGAVAGPARLVDSDQGEVDGFMRVSIAVFSVEDLQVCGGRSERS